MSKITKAMATLGVVAGLGVAALPLGAYAALPEGDYYKTVTSAQVEVEVEGAVSIATNVNSEATGTGIGANGIISLGKIMPGSITEAMTTPLQVTVSSNSDGANFDLYINTLEQDGALTGANTGAKINGGIPAAGTAAWGYTYSANAIDDENAEYAAVPTEATKVNTAKLATSGANATADPAVKATNVSNFKFKASAATTTTADTYRGTVVFTAVVE